MNGVFLSLVFSFSDSTVVQMENNYFEMKKMFCEYFISLLRLSVDFTRHDSFMQIAFNTERCTEN